MLALGAAAVDIGCGTGPSAGRSGDPVEGAAAGRVAGVGALDLGAGRPRWGPGVPALNRSEVQAEALAEALAAELARAPGDPALRALWSADEAETRARALWSLARIGGPVARDRLMAELDGGGQSRVLAAVALLEVPRHEAGTPADPDGRAGEQASPSEARWSALEDALWIRYALAEPSALGTQEALLLGIARVGGHRSVARFAVALGDAPSSGWTAAERSRWTAAMRALGMTCARGLALDEAAAQVVAEGIEGGDPGASEAALYALSRCARSSSEVLAESRASLVASLGPHVDDTAARDRPAHASLAWRALAALGELPGDTAAVGILSPSPPVWTVEVEAVRALGTTGAGRAIVRTRLSTLPIEAFAGPRQHVLSAALEAMRGGIAGDPSETDAALSTIALRLLAGRRQDADPRLGHACALALCELRLLQAIRSGRPELVEGCARGSGSGREDPSLAATAATAGLSTAYLAGLEVEALLRATHSTGAVGHTQDNLGTATVDENRALIGAGGEAETGTLGRGDPVRQRRIATLLAMARDPDPARATPALNALAEVDDAAVLPVLRVALIREDPGILAAAATAIAVRSIDASKRDLDVVELLEDLVQSRLDAGAMEARLAAIEALGALARSAVATLAPKLGAAGAGSGSGVAGAGVAGAGSGESPWLARTVIPLASDPAVSIRRAAREALLGHPLLLARFEARELAFMAEGGGRANQFGARLQADLDAATADPATGLRIETSAGGFTIVFSGVPAPINQANLAALTSEGFYDGLSFHRVVPGFVVQGGDPRGDGYGGPGYLVPCEWSNLRYERGTVGIALAGRDTGGSQFFITQTPQPHLDARYTVVGQVSAEDMAVVDLLLPGDRILRASVLWGDLGSAGAR